MKARVMTEEAYAEHQAKVSANRANGGHARAAALSPERRKEIALQGVRARWGDEPRSKHGAVKTVVDGIRFDSKLEARVWQQLKLREKAGEIRGLRRQVRFSLFAQNFEHIGILKLDFVYEYQYSPGIWLPIYADAKSAHTRNLAAWQRTKNLFAACTGKYIVELP